MAPFTHWRGRIWEASVVSRGFALPTYENATIRPLTSRTVPQPTLNVKPTQSPLEVGKALAARPLCGQGRYTPSVPPVVPRRFAGLHLDRAVSLPYQNPAGGIASSPVEHPCHSHHRVSSNRPRDPVNSETHDRNTHNRFERPEPQVILLDQELAIQPDRNETHHEQNSQARNQAEANQVTHHSPSRIIVPATWPTPPVLRHQRLDNLLSTE